MLNICDLRINDIVQTSGTAIMITSLKVVIPKGSNDEISVVNDLPIETIKDIKLTDDLLDRLFMRDGENWWVVDKDISLQRNSGGRYSVNSNFEGYTTVREILNAICSDMVFFGSEKDLRLGILLTINNTR